MTSHLTVTLRWTKIALWFCKVFTETFLEVRRDIFPLGAVLLSFVLERNHFEGFLHVFFFFFTAIQVVLEYVKICIVKSAILVNKLNSDFKLNHFKAIQCAFSIVIQRFCNKVWYAMQSQITWWKKNIFLDDIYHEKCFTNK